MKGCCYATIIPKTVTGELQSKSLYLYLVSNNIHISTRNVSFLILIGQKSVAEWLIVASINHNDSNQKQPTK